ncbi:hypothetical protein Ptr902_08865 [Pyrenophora tritici-repentis]|uniref:Uncharacterized protein n=1 Tax=Pyrenophora tritici-repentis TaxID=45151 RepID=A0A5M9LPI0_9PLEO|nr:hypothetical protein PtrV1_03117 [Pyrenophora tritici-repentis]KAF7442529.1 hypothetical protein A1F99_133980 [Pyrenophora tritici-repentis]KAF7579094.1 hypothetical protein PtrM4_033340 [Pyrenophora tritici-repentis]KAI0575128.1 hypothetical protein Alg215_08210 [Pyrenophora tritici-repentis]KAI0579919.1 hypothetical protein Alg130_07288 [Pyrenophora tritici-repentis]
MSPFAIAFAFTLIAPISFASASLVLTSLPSCTQPCDGLRIRSSVPP